VNAKRALTPAFSINISNEWNLYMQNSMRDLHSLMEYLQFYY
jgi:hypothetical protein